jgi:hypothetical protein
VDGVFTSVPEDLRQLARVVYEGNPPKTEAEVVTHTVLYQAEPGEEPEPVVLVDCNGEMVGEMLRRDDRDDEDEEDEAPRGELDRAVFGADGLILAVDASASPERLEKDFEAFDQFLHYLEGRRGRSVEVSGLPVFLVLTKCDELARPGESLVDWVDQIEQRKREVDEHFRDFLARKAPVANAPGSPNAPDEPGEPEGVMPFGRIDLHLWATAVRRPRLARTPGGPEPYGVAELFRQTVEQADAYHERRQRAGRRLFWTVSGSSVVVTLMLAVAAALAFFNQRTPAGELAARIDSFRFGEKPTAAERLRTSSEELRQRLKLLQQFHDDPHFGALAADDQEYVEERLREIRDYLLYLDRILETPRPADLTRLAELERLQEQLNKELAPRPEWAQTVAGELYGDLKKELEQLLAAVASVHRWYRDNGNRAFALATFGGNRLPGKSWYDDVKALLAQSPEPPLLGHDLLPGSQTLTPATLLGIDQVMQDRGYWERMRHQLQQVRNITAALGWLDNVPGLPAVLDVRDPFRLEDAGPLVRQMQQAYPAYATDFTLDRLPDKVRQEVARAALARYRTLLAPARALVLQKRKQLGWDGLRDWLKNPTELADFAVLARTLARLFDHAEPADPVVDLRSFLERKRFTIYPGTLLLEVPDDFSERVPPNAPLTITHVGPDGDRHTLVYRVDPDRTDHDEANAVTRYVLLREEGERIGYRPGDELNAELRLRNGERLTYSFERLVRPPRLHRANQRPEEGSAEDDIYLRAPAGDEGIPRLPDLLPSAGSN